MAKIASGTTARSVEEWIGKTPDSKPPERVLLRIFERAGGRCHVSGRAILPGEAWQAEHIIALADGGLNCEGNLAPVLAAPHKNKSAAEAADRKKVRAQRKKHVGIKTPPKNPIKSRGFEKSDKPPPKIQKIAPPRQGGIKFRSKGK